VFGGVEPLADLALREVVVMEVEHRGVSS